MLAFSSGVELGGGSGDESPFPTVSLDVGVFIRS
jgi:hypothetical protein